MDVEIRTISEDEFATYARAVEMAFSDVPSDEDIERERVLVEYDRSFAAFDGPDIVGTGAAFTMPMTVPGRRGRRRVRDRGRRAGDPPATRHQHATDARGARRRARAR